MADDDLTARLIGLRDVLRDEVKAGQALAAARMDGMDAARQQYLGSLAAEREALADRISTTRELARTENQALEQLLTVHLDKMQQQIDQRFDAEAEARRVALDTATAAVQAALRSAETAVSKAELATEKRFEGVNEFRQSLADQTAAFPTRTEVTAQLEVVRATADRNTEALKDIELRFTSRLDLASGRDTGQGETRTEQRLNMSQVIAGIATLVAVISLVLYAIKK